MKTDAAALHERRACRPGHYERKTQFGKIIAENQASIAAAEKDAAYYRKRSGSYARRNEKTIQRQLVVLNNNDNLLGIGA